MKILVTGAGGYIGYHLLKLIPAQHTLHLMDKAVGFSGDVTDRSSRRRGIEGANAIIHLAGLRGQDCEKYPSLGRRVNLQATLDLLKEAPRDAKFIFASSCSVYGKAEDMVDENSPVHPTNFYAELKVQAEKEVLERNGIVLRFATCYGQSTPFRQDLIVHEFIQSAKQSGRILLHQPEAFRPICHVRDIAEGIMFALDYCQSGIYNVGGDNLSKKEIAQEVQEFFPCQIDNDLVYNHDPRSCMVDFGKIVKLGYKTRLSLGDALSEIYKYGFSA